MSSVNSATRSSAVGYTAAASGGRAANASRSNADLMPPPMDLGGDSEGLTIMLTLNAASGRADAAGQRGQVAQARQLRQLAQKEARRAHAREAKEASKKKEGGGLFGGFKKLVTNVVSNVTSLRPDRLATDLVKDLKSTLDVTDPKFWQDIGTIAKTYGKLVAVACAAAATAVTGGAFAVACAVAVCIVMATSVAMEECQLADALELSQEWRTGINIGCTVVAAAATLGAGAAASGANTAVSSAVKAANGLGKVVGAAGDAAQFGGTVAIAKFEETLDLLRAAAKESEANLRQAGSSLDEEVAQLSDIMQSYEKAQQVLVDAMNINQQARSAVINGARA